MPLETEKMKIGTEISFNSNTTKVMLNAQDLLIFLLCDTKNETKEVTKYRHSLAEQIASIIKDPISL